MKAFNDLADFSGEEIAALLELAILLDEKPEPKALTGKVLALLFLSPSLRIASSDSCCSHHRRHRDHQGRRLARERKKTRNRDSCALRNRARQISAGHGPLARTCLRQASR